MTTAPAPAPAGPILVNGCGTSPSPVDGNAPAAPGSRPTLFDIAHVDLARRLYDRAGLERYLPHRGQMLLLDALIWHSQDFKQGVGVKHARHDEFWVPGHFPGRPMLPGVLMIEAGAQLATFLYNARFPEPKIAAFIKIEDVSFRNPVLPGQDLILLCHETKFTPRRFSSDMQGLVDGKIAFEACITGMAL